MPVEPYRVQNPPARPTLIWDGDCRFCGRWVRRFERWTGEAVAYAKSQEAGAYYPEIPPSAFDRAVQLVEPDGTVSSGAAACTRSLRRAGWFGRLLDWKYRHVPGVAPLTEAAYRFVAKNRAWFSKHTP